MDFNTLLSLTLLIGAIAGWFAGQLVQGTGCGLLGDIFVGIGCCCPISNSWSKSRRRHRCWDSGRNLGGSYPAPDRATDKASFRLAVQVSVREWARSTIGPKFRRGEAVWSAAVTYKHGLARPEFGKTASPECFHMHKNIGRLGTTG